MTRQKDLAPADSLKYASDCGGIPFDGRIACWIGVTVPRKIDRHDLELTREAAHLIPPGVGAAAAAVDQDEPLTPKRPSPARMGETNFSAIDLREFPVKALRWLARHSETELLQEGDKAEQWADAKVAPEETRKRIASMTAGPIATAIEADQEARDREGSHHAEARAPY